MSELIKPYEISVWEDILVKEIIEEEGEEREISYFKERKIADIGSNSMTAPNKAYNPVLHKNKNGEKTFSFSIKARYYDPAVEQMVENPFVPFLINERKIKLHYNDEWHDFIIKEQTESSEEFEWHYECQDAFVLELSKTGYNITFNSEIGNNQGSAAELAIATLENTDWKVAGIDVEPPKVNEPTYEAVIKKRVTVKNVEDDSDVDIEADTPILLFYSYIANKNGKFIQFILQDSDYEIDSNNNITATNYRFNEDLIIDTDTQEISDGEDVIIEYGDLFLDYQVYRIVYKQLTTYDPIMQRTVDRYIGDDKNIYHYSDYVYTSSDVVVSYVTNGSNFNVYNNEDKSDFLQGWSRYTGVEEHCPDIKLTTFPEGISEKLIPLEDIQQADGYIEVKFKHSLSPSQIKTENCGDFLFNSGIEDNSSLIEHISQGEKFLLRWRAAKAGVDSEGESTRQLVPLSNNAVGAVVGFYTKETEEDTNLTYNQLAKANVILHFHGEGEELNNTICNGYFTSDMTSYIIEGVPQVPSTKYIYIAKDDTTEYVWDTVERKYVVRSDSFLNYYYLVAEADSAISSTILSDPTTKIGIFFYINSESGENVIDNFYYFQDLQLTHYYEDADGVPVVLGSVPTAMSRSVDYFYVEPKKGASGDNVNTYATLEALALNEGINNIRPVYSNEDIIFSESEGKLFYVPESLAPRSPYDLFYVKGYSLEKILSIEASNSNCFNILQTIAETFECWLELEVFHDEDGAVSIDRYGKPTKYVYLRRYSGKDNFTGFKYGINLNSVERVIDSNEVVTKLNVDNSQSDLVDSGVISIQKADSNISGETYIINFDYFFNKGLLDKAATELDYIEQSEKIQKINDLIYENQQSQIDLSNSLNKLSANRNVYVTLLDEAKDDLTEALEEFYNLTNYTYEEYQQMTEEEREKVGNLTEIETIYDIIGTIYTCATTINNYEGLSAVTDDEYGRIQDELYGRQSHQISVSRVWDASISQWFVRVILDDYITPFGFAIGEETYETNVNQKSFYIRTDAQVIGNITYKTGAEGYRLYDTEGNVVTEIVADEAIVKHFVLQPNNPIKTLKTEEEELIEQKKKIIADFENKYSRFILEGNWNSNDYISDELYYLDAMNLSRVSAFPKITYNIQVTEISGLEDYMPYSFNAGDKTFIEDTEFFGWVDIDGIQTPAREEVIVSEIEWNLEDPSQNSITVQNYKTNFEDLFQRIQATVQTVQYNEATYPKTSSIVNFDGTIKENVLANSFNKINSKKLELTGDGAVTIDGNSLLIKNLTNNANYVRINSEGIQISSDGGATWATAVSGRGMDSGEVFTGTIDTDNIIIGGKSNSSFRWDSNGLSAYMSYLDENNVKRYDFKNYVRFDEYGVYGVQDGETFKAKSLGDVEETASFGITWRGFFIKNRYGNGYVSITNDNDFQVFHDVDGDSVEKIKVGALEWLDEDERITTDPEEGIGDPIKYGIRIRDDDGNPVFFINDDGDLSVSGHITASSLTIKSGDETYNGWDAINITGYSLVITMGDYISDTRVYLYPHLYHNGIEQFPEHSPGQEPTDEQKEEFYNHFIWYKNDSTTGILGDWRNNGRIVASRDSSYRLTYEFDDGSTEEGVPIEIIKVDPAEYITDIDDYTIQIHPKIWETQSYLQLDDSGNIDTNGTITADGDITAAGYNIGNTSLIDFFYPVGSVYQTYLADFDPNESWEGIWELLEEGYVLLSGSEEGDYVAGHSYGANTKKIEDANIAHGHGFTQPKIPNHQHGMGNLWSSGTGSSNAYTMTGSRSLTTRNTTNSGGGGRCTEGAVANLYGEASTRTNFNVMQQSFAVYIWYRVA